MQAPCRAESPKWDSISRPQDRDPSQRQTPKWATQAPPLVTFVSIAPVPMPHAQQVLYKINGCITETQVLGSHKE